MLHHESSRTKGGGTADPNIHVTDCGGFGVRCGFVEPRETSVAQSVTGGPARWVPSQLELLTADPEVPARGHDPVDLDRIS